MNDRGKDAEARAAKFLESQGLQIVARNYRGRYGEIDLIAKEGATLVFVEVRARASNAFGGAAASITASKREKLTRTALQYLATLGRTPPCRFDAVLMDSARSGGNTPSPITWIRDAFST